MVCFGGGGWFCLLNCISYLKSLPAAFRPVQSTSTVLSKPCTDILQWALIHRCFSTPKSIFFLGLGTASGVCCSHTFMVSHKFQQTFKPKVLAHLLRLLKKSSTTNYNPLHTAGPVITLQSKQVLSKDLQKGNLHIYVKLVPIKKISHCLIH